MKTLKHFAIAYIIASIFYVLFIQKYVLILDFKYHFIIPIFKSVPDLIALFLCFKFLNGPEKKWMVAATAACAVGDILLGISRYNDYIPALIAYLCGHILFTIAFSTYKKFSIKRLIPDIFVVAYTIMIGFIVIPKCSLGNAISVSLYIIVITTMAIFASFINLKKYYIVFIGACLFILSDSINAVDKFVLSPKLTKTNYIKDTSNETTYSVIDDHRICNFSIVDSQNPIVELVHFKINLLQIIISLYYSALFFIVFGMVYILQLNNPENEN